jgi:transcriptional regulator GlxA family with amidase domain
MALSDVAVVVCDGVSVFELGVVCEVFGVDRTDTGLPGYAFAVCSGEPGPVRPLRSGGGFAVTPAYGLDRLATADLVAVPHWRSLDEPPPEALLSALRAVVARGGRVMSVCSGAFVLAAAGLLDGRRASTHWRYAAALAARYPLVDVDPNVLYVDAGPVLTSAGTAAGIDLCLHIVREEHGVAVANAVARRMVVPPHRDGGQAQFVDAPVPARHEPRGDLGDVLAWAVAHLDSPLSVEVLAARAVMSPRTFARRFRAATGTTPYAWLLHQRTLLAQRLLEAGHGVDEVARRSGFGSAATLREHFGRVRGTSPSAYRRAFAAR